MSSATMEAPAAVAAPKTKKIVGLLFDKILVRRDSPDEITKHGIYLPQTTTEQPTTGVVVAIGTGICNFETGGMVALPVKVGQRVMFSKYGGLVVKVDDEELLVMSVMDVIGTLEEVPADG